MVYSFRAGSLVVGVDYPTRCWEKGKTNSMRSQRACLSVKGQTECPRSLAIRGLSARATRCIRSEDEAEFSQDDVVLHDAGEQRGRDDENRVAEMCQPRADAGILAR